MRGYKWGRDIQRGTKEHGSRRSGGTKLRRTVLGTCRLRLEIGPVVTGMVMRSQQKCGAQLRKIDGCPPGLHTLKLHTDLSRHHNSILTQLRTGCSHLRGNLFKMRIKPSPFCVCGHIESREHLLLSCPLFALVRHKLRVATKGEPLEVSKLLFNPLLIPATLTYINETEQFS